MTRADTTWPHPDLDQNLWPHEQLVILLVEMYNNAHLYLQERHLESWLMRLDELELLAADKISTLYPGHGSPAGLELIARTRAYLHDFSEAIKTGDAETAEQRMLAKYPD